MTALLDTSFLYALTDESDSNHNHVFDFAKNTNENLVLPVVILPEICYLVATRLGHYKMRRFVSNLTARNLQIESTTVEDLTRIGEVLKQYADAKLDFTNAAIVAMAERLTLTRIYTLDRRDFGIICPYHCDYFELLPAVIS